MEEEMISSTITKSRGSDSSGSSSPVRNRTKPSSRFKGVVPQANGNWGAQIYADHNRIWLGTFRTEDLAAAAYDSAAILLRHGNSTDSQRNFPTNNVTIHEPTFQVQYTRDQVLNMIKDGSYQTKFCEFITSLQVDNGSNSSSVNSSQSNKEGGSCKELFRKELTPSDVGKLNRLVIPKRYAVKYFSRKELDHQNIVGVRGGQDGETEITFLDKSKRDWKFRYCFWQSSSSYVFTKGWNNFVKEKHLDAKDTVVFYMCELRENSNGNEVVQKYFMVDVIGFNESEVKEGISSRNRGVEEEASNDDVDLVTKKGKFEETVGKNENEDENENKGIRLFGVQILPPSSMDIDRQ